MKAAGKYGLSSMTFALVPLVIGVYEHSREKNLSGFVFSVAALILIMWGCYLAWNEEHKKLQLEKARNARPEFRVNISSISHDITPKHEISWLDAGNTYVAKMSVVNIRPSPASIQSVYVTIGGESKRFAAEPFNKGQLCWSENGISRKFSGQVVTPQIWKEETISDILPHLAQPMAQGSHKDGWVRVTDLPSVADSGAFNFYVVDAYGESHGPFLPTAEMAFANIKER